MANNYYTVMIIYVIVTLIAYGMLERLTVSGRNSVMIADVVIAEKVENLRMASKNNVGLTYLVICTVFSIAFVVGVFSV